MFKHSANLFNLRKTEADLIAQISGAQGTSRNLQARIHELDQRSLKQQEMLYSIEFQVQQLERKVSRASGKRSLEETVALNAEIAELQQTLLAEQEKDHMINNQVRRLNDDLRAARRKYDKVLEDKAKLQDVLASLELETSSSAYEVKETMKDKEGLIVAYDVLKLEAQRLRGTLKGQADGVLDLENRCVESLKSLFVA
jgi:chromosome segregation ATPase